MYSIHMYANANKQALIVIYRLILLHAKIKNTYITLFCLEKIPILVRSIEWWKMTYHDDHHRSVVPFIWVGLVGLLNANYDFVDECQTT